MTDRWVVPWLALLVDGSIRWGIVLAVLAVWFALRPPRRAATRHLLCVSALAAGAVLPFTPRWGVVIPWHVSSESVAEPPATAPAPVSFPPPATAPFVSLEPRSPRPDVESSPARPAAYVQHPRPAAVPLDRWRLAALATAGAWAIVVAALIARLACGGLVLVRMRRGLAEAGEDADRLVDECRARLGTSRPVRLALHPGVASPVVLGGLRPLVLVPTDWNDWPEPQRRACLLHETAHLARYDDWSKFAQELIRVPFFFHPLALWLFARLDRERELLCDEAVVALGTEPESLARLLLDLAKRPVRLVPVSRPVLLPFLDRRTVLVRIERLLEDDMPRSLSRASLGRSLLFGSLALAACLAVGGLQVRGSARPQGDEPKPAAKTRRPRATPKATTTSITKRRVDDSQMPRGVVLDPDGRPVPDAMLATSFLDPAYYGSGQMSADDHGRFTYSFSPDRGEEDVFFVAWKEGVGAAVGVHRKGAPRNLQLRFAKPKPLDAVILDEQGKPIAGAKVRVTALRQRSAEPKQDGVAKNTGGYLRVPPMIIRHGPATHLFVAMTAADGSFSLPNFNSVHGVKLEVVATDGRVLLIKPRGGPQKDDRDGEGFVLDSPVDTPRLTAGPGARVSGRIVTTMPGVSVGEIAAYYQSSGKPDPLLPPSNVGAFSVTKADGRFVFDGLETGAIDILLSGPGANDEWTYRAVKGLKLALGETSEVTIELIPGVEVEGAIVAQGTGAPVKGAEIATYGSVRPRATGEGTGLRSDAEGRYYCRLPSGESHLLISNLPRGFASLPGEGSTRTVTIPDAAAHFEAPPIEVVAAPTVHGRMIDAMGEPIAGAKILGVFESGNPRPFERPADAKETKTDAQGAFRLPPESADVVKLGEPARLFVRLGREGGAEYEAAAIPVKDGAVVAQLPIVQKPPGGVEGPRNVAPDVLAALVVDPDGKPIEAAEVLVLAVSASGRQMITKNAKSDVQGVFQVVLNEIAKPGGVAKVEVLVSKPGREPQRFMEHPVGGSGWVVVLGNKTYFEGRVTGPDGKPVAGALVRANSGPKRGGIGYVTPGVWTEARTDDDGQYRMHAQTDVYDVEVRVPGVGEASALARPLGAGEIRRLDLRLDPGAAFRAKVVDSVTGAPVPGVRLWHWQYPDIVGRSDEKGELAITNMRPGLFRFNVEASGCVRWWSEQAAGEHSRRYFEPRFGGWQYNSGFLEFELKPGMAEATVVVERAVTLSGRVVDPDGKPFTGATVALNLIYTDRPGTFSSGYTFEGGVVESGADGAFRMTVPASNDHEYNLLAHDGKEHEWRTWANGVLPSIRTKPGDVIGDLEIRLTRPATFRGRVFYRQGRPARGHRVHISAVDGLDNHTYDRSTETAADGSYELKFLRPGEHLLQVDPNRFSNGRPIENPRRVEKVTPGELKEGVDFQLTAPGERPVGRQAAR